MISKEFIRKEFPEFDWIEDVELRDKCVAVLQEGIEAGGWTEETVYQCPIAVSEMSADCPVHNLDHIHDVTNMCKAVCDWLLPRYSFMQVDWDIIIAAALLHDVGKFTEYGVKVQGKPVYTEKAKLMRHPLAGALLASKHGLPDKLVQIIATHSFEGNRSYQCPEALLMKRIDTAQFGMVNYFFPAKKAVE